VALRKKTRLFVVLVLLSAGTLACGSPAVPTPTPISYSTWTSFTNGNDIRDLAFDGQGNLWAASSGGAVRWDLATCGLKAALQKLRLSGVQALACDSPCTT
jgi:ligand-binding sensor domain-containing protein